MLAWILRTIICDEFDRNVGRWQAKEQQQHGMKLSLTTSPVTGHDSTIYNHTVLLIYGEGNCVGVYVKEHWNPAIEGASSGESEWACLCCHDSGWREAVERFLFENETRLICLDFGPWYEKTPITTEVRAALKESRTARYSAT